jgi:hypothetical protein
MAFDVQGALKDGYSPAEIADYLASKKNFDIESARKDGFTDDEIVSHLASRVDAPKAAPVEQAPAPAKPAAEPPGILSRAAEAIKGTVSGIIPALAEKVTPYKSVMETAPAPTPQEQQAEVDKRLSYGAGPVSKATVAQADLVRSGMAQTEDPRVKQIAQEMANRGETGIGGLIERAKRDQLLEQETESARRQRFAEENPLLGSVAAGSAGMVSGMMNIPSVAADAFNQTFVNPALQLAGLKPLARVPTAFGTEYLAKGAEDFTPQIGKRSMEGAWKNEEFAPWLMSKLAANSPQMAQQLAAAFVPPLRVVLLPGMAGTAAGQSYAQGDDSRVAVAKGAIEYGTEKLPLHVFDKLGDVFKGVSVAKQNAIMAIAGQRLAQAGGSITANGITNAIEETAAQFGGNVLDKFFQGKDIELSKGLGEAAVIGAVTGKAMSAPQVAGILSGSNDPNAQIARAIEQNIANTQFGGTEQAARDLLNPQTYDARIISPLETSDPSRILQSTSVDDAVASANDLAGSLEITPAPIAPAAIEPAPLPAIDALGRVEPTFDANAPVAPLPAIDTTPALTLPEPNVATEQQFGLDKLRLNAPRPQKIQGVAVSQLSDDQLQAIATDESVPAITRRGASVELTARQTEAAGTTPAAGPINVPSVPLPNAPAEQNAGITADKTLAIPESQVPSTAIAPVGGEPAAAGARATAQAAVDRWAAANGIETPAVFNAAPADLDSAVNGIAQALNSQFGGRVYAYNDDRANALNGLAIGGAAFINTANVDTNVARTGLHEFHHTVEQLASLEAKQGLTDTPAQQYVASMNGIFDGMTDEGKRAYLENFLIKDELAGIADPVAREQRLQEAMAGKTTRSEMTADFLGNRATDKKFWQDVAAVDPQGFKGFVDKWLNIIDNLIDALKGTATQGGKESAKVDTYLRDLNKAKSIARDALVAYNRGIKNGSISTAAGQGVSESAASARQLVGGDGGGETPEYGTAREGAVSVLGRHYSTEARTSLNGAYYGTGLKGAERDRLDGSPDPRLKNRIYFYVDQGSGIRPESGVGSIAHEVRLNNIYDPKTQILPVKGNFNAFESAVINGGFDGYVAPFGNNQAAVVLLGPRHSAVPVRSLGRVAGAPAPTPAETTTLKKGLLSKELATIEAARVPGARVAAGNLEIPTTSRDAANAELERIGSNVRFSKKEIPESLDEFAKLETVIPRAREGSYSTNRQLKVDLQSKILEAAKAAEVDLSAQNDETTNYLTRVGVADALYAIQSNANAVGWYDKTVTKALRILGKIHPEINTDPNAKFAFTWALAVTSNGLKVDKNFELAERAYKDYKRTGKMPTNITAGQAQKAINESLDLFNKMVAQYGIDDVRRFMDSKFRVSQIERATGLDVGGEFKETEVRGAAVLGPKIGNGFYSNLNGFFDQLTMDRWLMRTWGRWTGTLIEARPDMVKAKQDELATAVAKMKQNAPAALEFQKALGAQLQTDNLDALALAIQKASMDPATREIFNRTQTGEAIRKTGNALAKYLDGQKEAPAGPQERNYIRKVFNKILTDVRSKGYPALTMSDLQALLWYPEKRLYDIAKSDENAKEGYSDDEAPDYANAAAKLARGVGVSDTEIQQAINDAEKDYENRISAGPAESTAGGQQASANVPEAVRGFGEREGRTFLTTGVVHRVRSAGTDPTNQPNSYKRKGGGDDKGSRVLGIPSVAIFSPATTFKNALGEVPAAAPKFFEVGADGAKTFRDSIQASKEGSVFGASVYVYDQADYEGMRLFLTEDGAAGFALKGDDIVSVFAGPSQRGAVNGVLQLATQEGGRRLDAFDTVLPHLYSIHGFKTVARSKWNDDFAPDDWNKETFKAFNRGEPDVVFMVHDPKSFTQYDPADGKVIKDYDQGAVEQASALTGIKQVRQTDLESLESVFKSLEKRGLAKANAEAAVKRRPDAAQITYMQDNFLDILDELDTAGLVEINC